MRCLHPPPRAKARRRGRPRPRARSRATRTTLPVLNLNRTTHVRNTAPPEIVSETVSDPPPSPSDPHLWGVKLARRPGNAFGNAFGTPPRRYRREAFFGGQPAVPANRRASLTATPRDFPSVTSPAGVRREEGPRHTAGQPGRRRPPHRLAAPSLNLSTEPAPRRRRHHQTPFPSQTPFRVLFRGTAPRPGD